MTSTGTIEHEGAALHYELLGDDTRPHVAMIAGLGGAGRTWGEQIEKFACDYRVVLVDQRGTGRSTHTSERQTIAQHASDVAAVLAHVGAGPVHVVGSSTGGAIAQRLALDHPAWVRTLTIGSSWARPDAYLERELRVRRDLVLRGDGALVYGLYALLLFSPRFAREHPEAIQAWIDRATSQPFEAEIAAARLEMLLAHDTLDRLGEIVQPALVLCGTHDMTTPPQLSEELAAHLPDVRLETLVGGHMVHAEDPDGYYARVHEFIEAHA